VLANLPKATRSRSRDLVAFCALAALFVAAVILAITSSPGKGMSREDAVQRAWHHTSPGAVAVVSAEVREDFNTGSEAIPIHHWSWVVVFRGSWDLLCIAGPTSSCHRTTEWVAIDYYTGDWIASEFSYQAPD
jgi:hypothetical protein